MISRPLTGSIWLFIVYTSLGLLPNHSVGAFTLHGVMCCCSFGPSLFLCTTTFTNPSTFDLPSVLYVLLCFYLLVAVICTSSRCLSQSIPFFGRHDTLKRVYCQEKGYDIDRVIMYSSKMSSQKNAYLDFSYVVRGFFAVCSVVASDWRLAGAAARGGGTAVPAMVPATQL